MKRGYVYAAIAAILVVCLGLYSLRHRHDKIVNAQIKSTALAPTEQAKVIVDPVHHTITTVTRQSDGTTKTSSTFLPRRGAAVDLGKNGSVLVTAPKWGTEVDPFLGAAFGSDIKLRAALGLNLLYVQRWELGGGLLVGTDIHDTRVFAHVSYNAYDNVYVAVGVDNRRTAHLMAGLKF